MEKWNGVTVSITEFILSPSDSDAHRPACRVTRRRRAVSYTPPSLSAFIVTPGVRAK